MLDLLTQNTKRCHDCFTVSDNTRPAPPSSEIIASMFSERSAIILDRPYIQPCPTSIVARSLLPNGFTAPILISQKKKKRYM
jgi:hypothetical protein